MQPTEPSGKNDNTGKSYPRGHFTGIGIAIGIPLGIPIGLALNNIALGPAIGAAIGIALGIALESKYNSNPRQLTPAETRKRKRLIAILIGLIIGGVAAFTLILVTLSK